MLFAIAPVKLPSRTWCVCFLLGACSSIWSSVLSLMVFLRGFIVAATRDYTIIPLRSVYKFMGCV